MSEPLMVRPLTEEEGRERERLARSQPTEARLRDRGRVGWLSHHGRRVSQLVPEVGRSDWTGRKWRKRCNAGGLAGRQDRARAGRPPTYPAEEVGAVVAASLTDPDDRGVPFGSGTLDRLAAYRAEEQGIAMKRSRIGEVLVAEGVRWRQQETGFGQRPAPVCAEPRGPS